jgi:hypothetical protein
MVVTSGVWVHNIHFVNNDQLTRHAHDSVDMIKIPPLFTRGDEQQEEEGQMLFSPEKFS